jgi:O-antigen ligase
METGSLTTRPARWRSRRVQRGPRDSNLNLWPIILGLAVAAAAGVVAGTGEWELALLVVGVPAFTLITVAAPERTALTLIVILPFFVYPASVGGFSVFLAIPTFGFVSIVLLTRHRPTLGMLRADLPVVAFALVLLTAVIASIFSIDPLTTSSRLLYLVLFALFAFAIASSIAAGRLSHETVAKALLISGAFAGTAIIIQFLIQFGVGKSSVMDWLFDVRSLFAGDKASVAKKSNWVVDSLNVVRGIFPFMTPASAGQFLMFCLISGLWLRRERKSTTDAGSGLVLVMLLIVAVALLFTLSRQSWLGAGMGVVALGLGRRPLWMVVVAVQLVLVVSLVPIPGVGSSFGDYLLTAGDTQTESSNTRLALWETSIRLIPENALIGAGPGTIGLLGGGGDRPFYAHNVFLDAAVELGVFGLLALLAMYLSGMSKALRNGSTLAFAMLAALFVASLFDDAFYFPRNGLAMALAFALAVRTADQFALEEPVGYEEERVDPGPRGEREPARALA